MFARRQKNHEVISRAFEDQFAAEILKSDKLRVTILISVITTAVLVVLGLAFFGFNHRQLHVKFAIANCSRKILNLSRHRPIRGEPRNTLSDKFVGLLHSASGLQGRAIFQTFSRGD